MSAGIIVYSIKYCKNIPIVILESGWGYSLGPRSHVSLQGPLIYLYKAVMCVYRVVPWILKSGFQKSHEPYHAVVNDKKIIFIIMQLFQKNTLRNKVVIVLNFCFGFQMMLLFLHYYKNPREETKVILHVSVSKQDKLTSHYYG